MKKALLILFVLSTVISCRSDYPVVLGREPYELPSPPATVWIAPNLFVDQHECTNYEYIEYLGWLSNKMGEDSKEFKAAVPVFFDESSSYSRDYRTYMRDEALDEYPVVGVTYEQARAFAEWKTERVNDHILLERRMLVKDDLNFSFSKYFTPGGPHIRYAGGGPMPMVQYRLPTKEEWKRATTYLKRNNINVDNQQPSACEVVKSINCKHLNAVPAQKVKEKEGKAYNLESNVAEWLAGGATTPASEWMASQTEDAKEANLYTGFRLVAMYELRDINWSEMLFPAEEESNK